AGLREGDEARHLWSALHWLQQSPPEELQKQSIDRILDWGIEHWSLEGLAQNNQNTIAPEGY
ncbi:MAG: hypothetical protein P8N61_07160, partial [Porticoccaceae bacterium]|nr:hypothetical protein [Porticoccaceae bacterium]